MMRKNIKLALFKEIGKFTLLDNGKHNDDGKLMVLLMLQQLVMMETLIHNFSIKSVSKSD